MAKRPAAVVDAVPDPLRLVSSDTLSRTQHALYGAFIETWVLLAHVREGTGPFMDGTGLIAHPREWQDFDAATPTVPTKKLLGRRRLACYENIASTIIEAKQSTLFRECATRRFTQSPDTPTGEQQALLDWWEDVDGLGTDIDDYFAAHWDMAATFGHVYVYMDRPAGAPGSTLADAKRPFLRVYAPADVLDWRVDTQGALTDITFAEPSDDPYKTTYRRVNADYWTHFGTDGKRISGGPVDGQHKMGLLPVVQMFAKRRPLYRHIGQSVLGDPKLYQDVYNLTSEIRELLRNQTFSFINIPLGTGDQAMTVEHARAMLGGAIGAMNVIFSGQSAQILAGDADNVLVYHKEYERRLRTIYRMVGVQWEADSKDAEASGSLKLKREDMNTRLAAYADEVERADYAIARLFYRALYGADRGQQAYENVGLEIRYPDTFDMTPFAAVLDQAKSALALDFPKVVMAEILKSLLPKFLTDLDEDTIATLRAAIDKSATEPDVMAQTRDKLLAIANGSTGLNAEV